MDSQPLDRIRPSLLSGSAWILLGVLGLGCTGTVGAQAEESASGGHRGGGSGGYGGGGGNRDELRCEGPEAGPAPLRRLTDAEYRNTVADLLKDADALTVAFPPERAVHGFRNQASGVSSSALLTERYVMAAEELSGRAVANLDKLTTCETTTQASTCVRAWIRSFGQRAMRRPLRSEEAEGYANVFADVAGQAGYADGLRAVVEAMLLAPDFLYRVELEPGVKVSDDVERLNGWQMASRLSYFLWGSMPDEPLFRAAADDDLATPEQIRAQADRMLKDPRARRMVASFHEQWLGLGRLDAMTKDAALFPKFDASLNPALKQSVLDSIGEIFWEGDASWESLLTSNDIFVNAQLAAFLDLPRPADAAFAKRTWNDDRRSGLLTHPAVLAAYSKSNQTSPVERGRFIREQILCTVPPPAPADLEVQAPDLDPNLTTRERFAQHTTEPLCAHCHKLMDPLGLAFETYDAVGLWRSDEAGKPIDASGELIETDVDGPFNGAKELIERLVKSQTAKSCMVTQWFRFAHGRDPEADDACTVAHLEQSFARSGQDVRALMVALTQTSAFMYRRVP